MPVIDERWFRECGQPEHVREVLKYTVSLGTASGLVRTCCLSDFGVYQNNLGNFLELQLPLPLP